MKETKKTKTRRARIAALLMAALFLLTAFGGCGKRKDGAETVPEEAAAVPAAAPAEGKAAARKDRTAASKLVQPRGVEPPCLAALEPESSVSAIPPRLRGTGRNHLKTPRRCQRKSRRPRTRPPPGFSAAAAFAFFV